VRRGSPDGFAHPRSAGRVVNLRSTRPPGAPARQVSTPREYHFCSTWRLAAHPDTVFAALAALDTYPTWWPGVREARPLDAEHCALTIRSVLPIDLRFTACSARRDPVARVLEATLTGDIDGFSRWTLVPQENGTAALFEEHAVPRRGPVRRLSFARPLLHANHTIMMRRGEIGLRAHLAAGEPGR
jgi:hypothetical protein